MEELYWIERLDSIQGVFILLSCLSAIWLLFTLIIPWMEYYNNEDCKEKGIHKSRKISGVLLAVSVLILTFLPSTKEMYRIMGIGGTIDYIRQNETAKQLPDKCIKALDLFMDKVIEDGNDNKTLE